MKTIYFLLITAVIIITSFGCEKVLKDETLTLKKRPYIGNELRLDGYYYILDNLSGKINSSYFFYSDGTLLHGGGWPYSNLFEGLELNFNSDSWKRVIKENKQAWGVFNIDTNKISFERWYPSSGGPMPVYIRSGLIQNDTTFIITKSIHSKTGEEDELNEVYHFKLFSPKPDSTNTFL